MNEKRFVAIAAIVVLMLAAIQASGYSFLSNSESPTTGKILGIGSEPGIWEPPVGYGITFKEQVQEAMKHLENSRQLQEMSNSEDEIVEEIMKNWLENGFTYNEEIIRAPELLIAELDTPGVEEQAQEQMEKALRLRDMLGSILENNEDVFGEEGVENIKEALDETTKRIISEAGTNPYEDAYQPLSGTIDTKEEVDELIEDTWKNLADEANEVLDKENAPRDPNALNKNTDGSYDVGVWQINEKHTYDLYWNSKEEKLKQAMIDAGATGNARKDLLDPVINNNIAKIAWDRGDGVQDNDNGGGTGNWGAWKAPFRDALKHGSWGPIE